MRHAHSYGITLALALSAVPVVAGAQQRVGPTVPTSAAPGVLPPPALGREASRGGGSIPPGYVLHQSPQVDLVVGGSAVFLAAYVPMVIIAAEREEWLWAVPVVGPFAFGGQSLVAAGGRSTCTGYCFVDGLIRGIVGFIGGLLIVDGIAQAGGIASTVIGFARPRRVLRYDPSRAGVRWAMTPGAAGSPLGLTLSLTNF
jgi:hypothetical protein